MFSPESPCSFLNQRPTTFFAPTTTSGRLIDFELLLMLLLTCVCTNKWKHQAFWQSDRRNQMFFRRPLLRLVHRWFATNFPQNLVITLSCLGELPSKGRPRKRASLDAIRWQASSVHHSMARSQQDFRQSISDITEIAVQIYLEPEIQIRLWSYLTALINWLND